MQTREYIKANDAYLRLSIGNAPWPIGVTMVGIHERSGREKIFSNNVAHVLNDEVSRKYIQSLKRSFILFSPHTSNPTSTPPPKKKILSPYTYDPFHDLQQDPYLCTDQTASGRSGKKVRA